MTGTISLWNSLPQDLVATDLRWFQKQIAQMQEKGGHLLVSYGDAITWQKTMERSRTEVYGKGAHAAVGEEGRRCLVFMSVEASD